MIKARLFTDGGARGNPGPAAIGGVIYTEEKEIDRFGVTIGSTTNNQAEYQALLYGINLAIKHGIKYLDCYLDSELVVKQLKKEYRVKDQELAKIFVKVWNLLPEFEYIKFHHVAREKNKVADSMVNWALDKKTNN
ncbi:MAG: ribonuclease [Patescibacteria group bacterium]|nr:ribonuclease [Patescibacteria group bacterium]